MKNTIIIFYLLLTTMSVHAKTLDQVFQLIPQPQTIEVLSGSGINGSELKFVKADQGTSIPVLGPIINGLPQSTRNGKGVYLKLSPVNTPESPEGYVLEINAKGVTITARAQAGLFYGCQTLEQLLEDNRDFGIKIPSLKITDYPNISYRAVHFDTKHHLDRIEYYYREIDKLARYKINAVIWEVEDKLRYTRRPEIGASNAISKQEMQAISRYAYERNINISPLVQGLGHASFILKHHWELREDFNSDWEFCPMNPLTYELQFDLYKDALEAMPYSKYLHIGGDEISKLGVDERCKATGKSPFELQMYWLKKVCQFVTEQGRIPIFWDDMPLQYAQILNLISSNLSGEELDREWNTDKLDAAIDLFPKECIYMRWKYEDATQPAHQRILKWYHDKGLKVMAATAAAIGSSPVLPREKERINYIKGFTQLVQKNNLEGVLCTAWDDGSPHAETVWRGYIAQAEYAWNTTARTMDQFKEAHAQREYGFRPDEKRMTFLDELEYALPFYDGALVVSGRRCPAWGVGGFELISLPDKNKRGTWSETYKNKIAQAKKELLRYEMIHKGVGLAIENALRNRFTLQIYQQINELQIFPTRLILALHAYDTASGEDAAEQALTNISDVCQNFNAMRTNVENVYSQTRFLKNPEGYILDKTTHLSNLSNNNDWMFLYEQPMVENTKLWIAK